jgi:hypothetical protein
MRVKVTVPAFTVPPPLVTVADKGTVWEPEPNETEGVDAMTVVAAAPTVSEWVLSLLVAKVPPAL